MRYFVTADVHGYFSELKSALDEKGFFEDTEPHKLIICGDIYDRGCEALQLQEFILDLMAKDEIILIRGNHEDMTLELLKGWVNRSFMQRHHHSNGAIDTVCQLVNSTIPDLMFSEPEETYKKISANPFFTTIIPAMIDFYETKNYIFTHGWIPCTILNNGYAKNYVPIDNWREAGEKAWDAARWINGMEAAFNGIVEKGKTIVCGHWHCSFGHSHYKNDGGEFDNNPNFNPYYNKGIIALDACTPVSNMVNCIVIEDAEI